MGKIEKKKEKLTKRINEMETELRMSLTKKDSSTKEIDISSYHRKIAEMKATLNLM